MVVHVTSKDLLSSHRGVQPVHFAPSDAQDFCQVNKLLLPLFLHAVFFLCCSPKPLSTNSRMRV